MSSPQDRKAKIDAAAGASGAARVNPIVAAGVVAVLAIAVIVGGVVWASRDDGGSTAAASATTPPTGTQMGQPYNPYPDVEVVEGAPTVDLYEDFRCPICKVLTQAFGSTIEGLAADGKITLRVHLKTVIDANTGGDSSAVAGSSALCAADAGRWPEYHEALFAMQPEQETAEGFPSSSYEDAARSAGIDGDALEEFTSCTEEGRYVAYVRSVDDAASEAGYNSTPVLEVDGTKVSWQSFTTERGAPDPESLAEVLESGEVPQDKVATE